MSFSWTVITLIMNIVSLLFCTNFDSSIVNSLKIFMFLWLFKVCFATEQLIVCLLK